MQIRSQIRKQAKAFAKFPTEYEHVCSEACVKSMPVRGGGYHGKHSRLRHKARSRNHGNSTGQSKHAGKG